MRRRSGRPAPGVRRGRIPRGAAALAFAAPLAWAAWTFNALVRSAERVDAAWAQVANVMRRRVDLVPNLVEVTIAYAEHERALARELAGARTAYLETRDPGARVERMERLDLALRRAHALGERYPELAGSRPFANLRLELEGGEHRIAIERARYDEAVRRHRRLVRGLPSGPLARLLGFAEPPYFGPMADDDTP